MENKRSQLYINGQPLKVIVSGAHQKMLERLRWDPEFIKIQKQAAADKERKHLYINQIRKKFNLSPVWDTYLDWYLFYPDLDVPFTGSDVAEYRDEVTGKKFYIIPVEPETTLKNVKTSFSLIGRKYKEDARKIGIRRVRRKSMAPIQLMAFRLGQKNLTDKEILAALERHFPDESIVLSEVSLLKRDGEKLALGQK